MTQPYLPRTLESFVRKANAQFPVLMLSGPRQMGKTTLFKTLSEQPGAPERRYVTLDNPLLLSLAREEPALFLQRFPPPLMIDEIQYAPGEARADRDLFYSSYLQTYLQRDVRDLAQVGDLMAFTRFLRSAAARTAQLLNLADMARDVGIAPNTAKHWFSILVASGLVWLLEPYHSNLSKRLVKTPKLYFLDTGLAAYLTQWSAPATLEAGAMSGAIFETWVLGELLKSYWHNGLQAPFHYYRDKDQKEIDLLIVRDGRIHPIEIKKTAEPGRDSVRHFSVLKHLAMETGPGAVICLAAEPLPFSAEVDIVPAWHVG